jgi:HPr kinase/phosphorylase
LGDKENQIINVKELLREVGESLRITILNDQIGLDRVITTGELARPGLELAGYWEYFSRDRIQIFGNKEISFLNNQEKEKLVEFFKKLFNYPIPCVIFIDNLKPPDYVLDIASSNKIAILQSSLKSTEFISELNDYLYPKFAPRMTIHGSLVDVYGIGVLFTGRSGIGKSEIALDLVERGHRLVADDVVNIIRHSRNILIGRGEELLKHQIEIRGMGIIDVKKVFGIRAVRAQKRVEVMVELNDWNEDIHWERFGLDEITNNILGVNLPLIRLPVFPGKNITVISEVIALNQLLKIYGEFPAKDFHEKILNKIKANLQIREYLKKDFE